MFDRAHEKDVRVAGDTDDAETGQLLITKRCLCHIASCNYKCLNISLFPNSVVFYTFIRNKATKFLHIGGGLSIHAILSLAIVDVI